MIDGRYMPESDKPGTWERRALNRLLPSGRCLDVGAGASKWEAPGVEITRWDREQGDAHVLSGVAAGFFDWLLASHILEHLERPDLAVAHWVRVVRPGGHVLISVPHRDLYEKRDGLPSRWAPEHLRFYLPDRHEPPDTVGLLPWLRDLEGAIPFRLAALQTGDWGYLRRADRHPEGEYCIDALLQKLIP